MTHRLLWLTLFLLVSFSTADDDAAVMAKLSNSISPIPSTWSNDDFCKWEGITCDKSRRVNSISLPFKSLNGTLPFDLNTLAFLKTLDLQNNKLSGALPSLANLTFLQIVYLNDNEFTSIPDGFFLGLTNLQTFSISYNYLESWVLPKELTRCTSLRTFYAMEVNITGPFPENFTSLTNLEELILYHNQLNGSLPKNLNRLSKLTKIDFARNLLSGALPTLANLTLLQDVSLHENYFTSIPVDFFHGLISLEEISIFYNLLLEPWVLPKELAQCTKLRRIYADNANIIGFIPDIFDRLPDLQELTLSRNNLTGTLPSSLKRLSQLKSFDIDENSLSGPLPTLANLTVLAELRLNDNKFTSIPLDFFLGLPNLRDFSISNCSHLDPWFLPNDLKESTRLETFSAINANIIGSIPDIFNTTVKLSDLRLSYNNLTGTLPASFGGSTINNLWVDNQLNGLSGMLDVLSSMTQLKQAFLHVNAFSGPIPDLSNCTSLNDLQLHDNQLTGLVPNSLFSLKELSIITLQNNKLMGPIPVFKTHVNSSIGINSNNYCLPIPRECDPQVTALLEVAASLGYPTSLSKSWRGNDPCKDWNFVTCNSSGKNVTAVNFGKQNFSGTISPSLANLISLRNLSLNENNLTGTIPQSLTSLPDLELLNVSNNNLSGNIPKFPQKVKFLGNNNPLLGKHGSRRNNVSLSVVIGCVIVSVLGLGGIILLVCHGVSRKSHIKMTGNHGEIPVSESGNVMISMQLLEQATDSFNDNNVLGRGGFGTVYKGELHDGTTIAVKKMKTDMNGTKGMKEFHAEIGVLTKVRHRHLVALLGYCINDNERLLVYEYMPRGTLSQHLFKWREHNTQPLSWKQRVSIALDVGRGVEYLHSLAQQSFIHRDLKPANILLDDEMRAKVADFGLVKHAPDGNYSMDTRLAGTFGYLAPEYAATGRVTTKVDVFAFGVVLMQLITGRKALDRSMSDESCQLVTWFRLVPVRKQNMVKFIDQVLDTDDSKTLESILKVAELAHYCTASEPSQRPNMGYVVGVLAHLVEEWNPSRYEEDKTYGHKHHMSLPDQMLQDDEDTFRMLNLFRSSSF